MKQSATAALSEQLEEVFASCLMTLNLLGGCCLSSATYIFKMTGMFIKIIVKGIFSCAGSVTPASLPSPGSNHQGHNEDVPAKINPAAAVGFVLLAGYGAYRIRMQLMPKQPSAPSNSSPLLQVLNQHAVQRMLLSRPIFNWWRLGRYPMRIIRRRTIGSDMMRTIAAYSTLRSAR